MTIRSEQTRIQLQQAFTALLSEKSYEAMTMADIARKAERTRATVYRHYADKEAMLIDCFEKAAEELKDKLYYPDADSEPPASSVAYTNLVILYTHVVDHRPIYEALFSLPATRARFQRVITGGVLLIMEKEGTWATMSAPIALVSNLLGEMITRGMVWCLESNSSHDPAVVAEIVLRMAETGFFGLTGQVVTESDISFRPFVAISERKKSNTSG